MKNSEKISWWSSPQTKIIELLNVNPQAGLTTAQVKEHRAQYGSNIFFESKPMPITTLIGEGFKEPMILLLLSIALLSLLFGQLGQAITMIFVVIAYISVELINKFRTDRIMVKLKKLVTPTTTVIRNNSPIEIPTREVVVGDILLLAEGDLIPADARISSSYDLIIDEASLTGESLPVKKDAFASVAQDAPLDRRINCVFSGTTVLNGQGIAVVMMIGQQSEMGKIIRQVQETKKEKTVLQQSMTKLAKVLAIFAFIASALIPALGYLRGMNVHDMILTWLSLTFLMIPGQPPIIITMALALAAFALAKKQIIVKRLAGVELLGQVTSIVSDKTGTITESTMKLETFFIDTYETKKVPDNIQEKIALALPDHISDPTDKAVYEALHRAEKNIKQIGFIGFSDKQPWRRLVYKNNGTIIHVFAGSPEALIAASTLSAEHKKKLNDVIQQQTSLGKRITAYASLENKSPDLPALTNLTFIALAIISDPVRPGVKNAIIKLEEAAIKTFIVTGDHKETAQAIAAQIGIQGKVITGNQFDKMTDQEIVKNLAQSTIFARMDPSEKLRLVKILQQNGDIVAAIGDGINDAPALKAAQVGIAMGRIGTDLAKEVSDLILADDNYVHIPDAIGIARSALDNFKKGLTYYLSAKAILLTIFLIPLALGIPFPFAPIQIIIIELLMDLASSTIFVTEEPDPTLMERPPSPIKNFLGKQLIFTITRNGLGLALGITGIYLYSYYVYGIATAQTAAFVAWLIGHIFLALNLKQERLPLFKQGIFSNTFAVVWLCAMVLLSLLITCVPPVYPYLKTTWLPLFLWVILLFVILLATFWIEVEKLLLIKKDKKGEV